MKKILLILFTLSIINCENSYEKKTNLIDLVPTNPLLLIKYESLKDYKSETFYKNFKSVLGFNHDSISNNFIEKPVLISYHNIGKNNLKHVLFTETKNVIKQKNESTEDSINYNGYIIKKLKKNNKLYYFTEKKWCLHRIYRKTFN